MAVILLPTQPTIQAVAQAQIQEATVATTVEAEPMPGTLSGKPSLIQATAVTTVTTATAATVPASQVQDQQTVHLVVQVPEAAVAVQTHRQGNFN